MNPQIPVLVIVLLSCESASVLAYSQSAASLPERTASAMKTAATWFHDNVAVHGGYVYRYSLDLKVREGEGKAAPTEIWVQPPGTPTVGVAYVRAWEATGDTLFLNAAVDAARALMHGQLESGAWSASIDFDPAGKNADRYRNGKGRAKGRNYSTLDDDKSQSAIRLMMEVDRALKFQDQPIHEATMVALNALLGAQFPNGAFPQGWKEPVKPQSVKNASYPDYEWRTENRIKDYWDYYTFNDGLAGDVVNTLHLAHQAYGDAKYRDAIVRFGDFLLLAQMPEPQPVWAQQYNYDMQPMWARKFEPPSVVSSESVDVLQTLLTVTELTGDKKYLAPFPSALAWFKRSQLPGGGMARFYELKSNKPLYFVRDTYELTYDDSNLPTHYSFKNSIRIDTLEQQFQEVRDTGTLKRSASSLKTLTRDAEEIISQLDSQGRWVTDKNGRPPRPGSDSRDQFLLSSIFANNLERLAEFLKASGKP